MVREVNFRDLNLTAHCTANRTDAEDHHCPRCWLWHYSSRIRERYSTGLCRIAEVCRRIGPGLDHRGRRRAGESLSAVVVTEQTG